MPNYQPRRARPIRPIITTAVSEEIDKVHDEVDTLGAGLSDVLARLSVFERALRAVIEDVDEIVAALSVPDNDTGFEDDLGPVPEAAAKEAWKSPALEKQEFSDTPDFTDYRPESPEEPPEESPEEEAARLRAEAQAAVEDSNEG